MLIRWEFVSRIKTALREKRWLGNSLSFLGTFLLLALAWRLFLRNAPLDLLKRCSWRQLLPLAALFMVLFAINGYHYFYLLRRRGIRMEKKDILLFPLAMGLWGILLPLQGIFPPHGAALRRAFCRLQAFLQRQLLRDRREGRNHGITQDFPFVKGNLPELCQPQPGLHQKALPSIPDRWAWIAPATSGLFIV